MDDSLSVEKGPIGHKESALFRGMTKAVQGAPEDFGYNAKWITSRRAALEVYEDRLKCGDWTILYTDMKEAELFKTRSGLIPCYILKVLTDGDSFQFGLNPSRYWKGELPFAVERTEGRLKYSKFSLILRIVLVVALIWYLFFRG